MEEGTIAQLCLNGQWRVLCCEAQVKHVSYIY